MTRPDFDKQAENTRFDVQAEAQKRKMDAAATRHADTIRGDTEANAGGQNRETGNRKARSRDRTPEERG